MLHILIPKLNVVHIPFYFNRVRANGIEQIDCIKI
jgi:hypothetical protein